MKQNSPFAWAPLLAYFASSFLMHLIWENAQMPLFESGDAPLWDTFTMCLFATATGDMLFMLTLYLSVAVIHKDFWWISNRACYAHPATWVIPVLIGVLLAISFELWAVHAVDRWEYSSMPLVPFIHVGVTPVLQMTFIPIASMAFSLWLVSRQSQVGAMDADT